jgi:hypothetical protein
VCYSATEVYKLQSCVVAGGIHFILQSLSSAAMAPVGDVASLDALIAEVLLPGFRSFKNQRDRLTLSAF